MRGHPEGPLKARNSWNQRRSSMAVHPDLLAPCGLYCGVCGILYATRDKNQKFLHELGQWDDPASFVPFKA